MSMNIVERLQLLRQEMEKHNLDYYLVPSIDAHNSEYVPSCWERRTWISGFDGSAGEALITKDHAYLWTDGRYFLQADQQLDAKHYTLMKQSGFAPEVNEWLKMQAKSSEGKKRLGVDPQVLSTGRAAGFEALMSSLSGNFVSIEHNLVDACKVALGEEMCIPSSEAYALAEQFTGESLTERLNWIQSQMVAKSADYIALNVLDEIAWLFNIRGSDIHFNPLVISYAIIGKNQTWLFVDGHKIPDVLHTQLKATGVNILDYAEFGTHLSSLEGSIWLDPKTANFWMENKAKQAGKIIFEPSPIVAAKASKNSTEAEGARIAHLKDAVAVSRFLCWLDNHWQEGVDELSCVDKLQSFRQQQSNLRGSSFDTISGFASNGAIIHYRVTPETNKKIDDSSLYLVDSGGQYLEGTTDITRTVHLGNPTVAQKRHYTLVLKGHLALARQQFPQGTCGEHLDVLARAALWNAGLNYRHGTGHGVGSFLCVHEGPQKISQAPTGVPLLPGMIVSNEPGFYLEGAYGIRIENLCLINASQSDEAEVSGFGPFYVFEDLTLVPYAKNLMDMDLLTDEEIDQIKAYYEQIRVKVRPNLGEKEKAWLDNQMEIKQSISRIKETYNS